jgi:hypothetical protein
MVELGFLPFYAEPLFLNSPSVWYPKPWGYFENETRVSFSISKKAKRRAGGTSAASKKQEADISLAPGLSAWCGYALPPQPDRNK